MSNDQEDVWIQFHCNETGNKIGRPIKITLSNNNKTDLDDLMVMVHATKPTALLHCDADELIAYPKYPYNDETKFTKYNIAVPNTTYEKPMIIVAPTAPSSAPSRVLLGQNIRSRNQQSQERNSVKDEQNIKREKEPAEIIEIIDLDEDISPDKTHSSTSTLAAVPSRNGFSTTPLNKSSKKSIKSTTNSTFVSAGGWDSRVSSSGGQTGGPDSQTLPIHGSTTSTTKKNTGTVMVPLSKKRSTSTNTMKTIYSSVDKNGKHGAQRSKARRTAMTTHLSQQSFTDAELVALFTEASDKAKRVKDKTLSIDQVRGVHSLNTDKYRCTIRHNHNLTGRSTRYYLCSLDKDLTKVIYYRLLGDAAKAKGLNPVKTVADITNNNNKWFRHGFTRSPITNNKRSNGGSGHGVGDSLLIGSSARGSDYSTMSTTTTTATSDRKRSCDHIIYDEFFGVQLPHNNFDNNNKRSNRGSGDRGVGGSIMIGNSARGGDYSPKSTITKAISSFDGSGGGGETEGALFVCDSSDDDDDDDDNDNDRDGGGGTTSSLSVVSESNKGSPTNTNTTNTSSLLVGGKWSLMVPRVWVSNNDGKGLQKSAGEKNDVCWSDIDMNSKHITVLQPKMNENIIVEFAHTEKQTYQDHTTDFETLFTEFNPGNYLVDNKIISTMHKLIKSKSSGVFDICAIRPGRILFTIGKTTELFEIVQNQTNYFGKNLVEVQNLFQFLEWKIKEDAKSFLFLNHVDQEVVGMVNKVNCFHMINDTGPFLKLLKLCIEGDYDVAWKWLDTVEFVHSKDGKNNENDHDYSDNE